MTILNVALTGCLFVAGLGAVGTPATAAAPPAVVALGDSFVSGEGAGSYTTDTDRPDNLCHRSTAAQITQVTTAGAAPAHRFNLGCSGATIDNVRLGGPTRYGEGSQVARLGRIARDHDVRLVVLTVGVNDVGYRNLVVDCVRAYFRLTPHCRHSWRPRVERRLAEVVPELKNTIRDIRQVMRKAGYGRDDYELVLQSYASPVTGDMRYGVSRILFGCPIRSDDAAWARDWVAPRFSAAFARAAREERARFLDLAPALHGREACAKGIDRSEEWARGISVSWTRLRTGAGATQESAHPNARGYAQLARCLSAFSRTDDRAARCVRRHDGHLAPVPTSLAAL